MAELDVDELRRRLAVAEVADVTALAGGASSLTFGGMRCGRQVVIKVAPPGVEPIAHRDVLRQAHVIKALAGTQVPVPEVVWEDPGAPPQTPPLFVMSHVEGDCVEPLFDSCPPSDDLPERYRNAARIMAALHSLSPIELGLGGESTLDPVAEVHRWCDTLQTVDATLVPDWQGVRDALLQRPPHAMRPSVVHGDFRLGNVLAAGTHVNAVIDWEIWSIGDPLVDLAWFVQFTDGENFPGVGRNVPGTPSATEVLDRYTAAAGTNRDRSETDWFFALGCLKLAAIQAHNRRRHLDGRFHDPYQALLGPSIDRHLSRGLETVT